MRRLLYLALVALLLIPASSARASQPVCVTTDGINCLGSNAHPMVTSGGGGGGGGTSTVTIVNPLGNQPVANSVATYSTSHDFTASLGTITTSGHLDVLNPNLDDGGYFVISVSCAASSGSGTIQISQNPIDSLGNVLGIATTDSPPFGVGSPGLVGSTNGYLAYPSMRINWAITGTPTFTNCVAEIWASNTQFLPADHTSHVLFVQGAIQNGNPATTGQANPILIGLTNGGNVLSVAGDTAGRSEVVGAVADGISATGVNPVLTAGFDGTNVQSISTDNTGRVNVNAAISTSDVVTTPATLNALNATQTISPAGTAGANLEIQSASSFVGTILSEYSTDVGSTWNQGTFYEQGVNTRFTVTIVNPTVGLSIQFVPVTGATTYRVRVSAYTSGSITTILSASTQSTMASNFTQIQGKRRSTDTVADWETNPIMMGGSDGTNIRNVSVDTSGRARVGGPTLPGNSLASTAPVIGGCADGGNLARNNSCDTSGNLNVNVVSNPGPGNTLVTGTINGAGQTIVLPLTGRQSASFQITASSLSGTTIQPEVSIDNGTTYTTVPLWDANGQLNNTPIYIGLTGGALTNAFLTLVGRMYSFSTIAGATHYRLRCTVFGSGSVTITMTASSQVATLNGLQGVQGPNPDGTAPGSISYPVLVGGTSVQQSGVLRHMILDNVGNVAVGGNASSNQTINSNPVPLALLRASDNRVITVNGLSNANNTGQGLYTMQGDGNDPAGGQVTGEFFACTGIIAGGAGAQNLASLLSSSADNKYNRLARATVSVAGTAAAIGIHLVRVTAASAGTALTNSAHFTSGDATNVVARSGPTLTTVAGDFAVVFANVGDHELLSVQGRARDVVFRNTADGVAVTTDGVGTGASFIVCFTWTSET